MKIHNEFEQQSVTWMQARVGVVTASEFGEIVTPLFTARTGKTPETYISRKLGEWWFDSPLPAFSGSYDTDAGNILEKEALPRFSLDTEIELQRVGFITSDDGKIGCSPDGWISDELGGVECKCPNLVNHLSRVLEGGVPDDHLAQVHFSMYVTGTPQWYYMSYHRNTPPLIVLVKRDEKIQARIDEALKAWLKRFEQAKARLIEINGGPPKRSTLRPAVAAPVNPTEPEYLDLIP